MENQNCSFQFTIHPNEMAGRVEGTVEECLCAYVTFCMCAGTDECLCFDTEEHHATSESDAIERPGVVKKSGAVETSSATKEDNATKEDDATKEDNATKEDDATAESGEVEESITIVTETSITISVEKSDVTEEQLGIREHPVVGRYRLEDTSSELFRCGMFALGISTSSQLGTQMTQSEFWRAFDSQEIQDLNRQRGWRNRNNFYDEQLAGVLRIWGRHHGLDNLQLGVIREGEDTVFIIGDDDKFEIVFSVEDMERQGDFTTVWIHNDNAGQLRGAIINHYSGITLLGQSEEPKDASEEESSAEEDSDTEMGDDAETRQETREENMQMILWVS